MNKIDIKNNLIKIMVTLSYNTILLNNNKDIDNNKDINNNKDIDNNNEYNKSKAKSNNELHEVICPICMEPCKFMMENYKIKLFDCKNGHKMENIKLDEYMDYQKIDKNKIFCDNCQNKNLNDAINNEFYKCKKCNMNLCLQCISNHDNMIKHMI